jgi:nucleotide-binding universal stress UspA family protein
VDFAIRKILVPTDFSESSEHAFRYAVALALDNDAEIFVLHVVEKFMDYSLLYSDLFPFQTPAKDAYQLVEEKTREKITASLKGDAHEDLRWQVLVTTGAPKVEIIRAAEREEIDLIVIATHGRSGLTHAILGSTTEKVVRRAPCPVLVVRKDGRNPLVPRS